MPTYSVEAKIQVVMDSILVLVLSRPFKVKHGSQHPDRPERTSCHLIVPFEAI